MSTALLPIKECLGTYFHGEHTDCDLGKYVRKLFANKVLDAKQKKECSSKEKSVQY
jgi:hypothetical protein